MSTSYFLLSKPGEITDTTDLINIDKDVVIYPPCGITYILPRNLASYYVTHGLFESRLINWCKQFIQKENGGVFLDIGAHTGTWSLSLAPLAKHVFSFEPQKMTYYALCGSTALSNFKNITCINKGLGSHEQQGKMPLYVVSDDGGGSTVQTTSSNVLHQEEIEIITLDSLHINDICFIKIDVEENELAVLQGAVETLKKNDYPPIVFECNDTNLSTNPNHELYRFINAELGYQITPIAGICNMFLAHKN
jgi:FkbM family methyltransferase